MALQLGALRDALDAAGVDRELARKAAEEVATYQSDIATLRAEIKSEFAVVHGRINLLNWMMTFSLALNLLVLGKLFGVIGAP